MQRNEEEKLYLDPFKLRLWMACGGLLVLAFLLWFVPVYQGWVTIKEAQAEAEVRRILPEKGKPCSTPPTFRLQ